MGIEFHMNLLTGVVFIIQMVQSQLMVLDTGDGLIIHLR